MLPIKALVWTIVAVIIEGFLFSKIAGYGLLLHGNFFTRACVILVVSLTGYVCLLLFYEPKIKSPEKRAVLITGCDTGFGHVLAKRLANFGFTVFAACLNADSDEAKQLQNHSERIHVLQMNVTSDEQVQSCVKRIVSILRNEGKHLWAVVNNAGIASVGFVEMLPLTSFEEIFAVNTIGTVRVSKAFIPLLRGHGRIINVTSLASRISYPYFSAYSMSKYATLAFSDSLRREMIPFKVKVVTIEPGRYRTSIIDSSKNMTKFLELWENSPEHTRVAYGYEFFEGCAIRLEEHLRDARPDIDEVISVMEEAITAIMPKAHYIPCEKVAWLFTVLSWLPDKVMDKLAVKALLPELIKPSCQTTENT